MLIRHAEKPARSAPAAGIDLLGHSDGHSLTRQGWTRATYLPDLFTPTTGIDLPGKAGLPQPRTIYASGAGRADGEGTRSRETVGPLAAALDLPVDTSFSRGQEVELARQAATAPGPVLICWQHDAIPAIAAAFAPDPTPPTTWPADRYDLVWLLTNTSTGWRFHQIPQLLLPDDATAEVR